MKLINNRILFEKKLSAYAYSLYFPKIKGKIKLKVKRFSSYTEVSDPFGIDLSAG